MLGSAQRVKGADLASVTCDLFFTGMLLAPQCPCCGWLGQLPGKGGKILTPVAECHCFCFGKRQCPVTASLWSEMGPCSSAAVP